MNKQIPCHAEIEYTNSEGTSIHSDICPRDCDFSNITTEYRAFLHEALDEWLNKSNGTGQFYISEEAPRLPAAEE